MLIVFLVGQSIPDVDYPFDSKFDDGPLNKAKTLNNFRRLLEKRGVPSKIYISPLSVSRGTYKCIEEEIKAKNITVSFDPRLTRFISPQILNPKLMAESLNKGGGRYLSEDEESFNKRVLECVVEWRDEATKNKSTIFLMTHPDVMRQIGKIIGAVMPASVDQRTILFVGLDNPELKSLSSIGSRMMIKPTSSSKDPAPKPSQKPASIPTPIPTPKPLPKPKSDQVIEDGEILNEVDKDYQKRMENFEKRKLRQMKSLKKFIVTPPKGSFYHRAGSEYVEEEDDSQTEEDIEDYADEEDFISTRASESHMYQGTFGGRGHQEELGPDWFGPDQGGRGNFSLSTFGNDFRNDEKSKQHDITQTEEMKIFFG